MQFRVTRITVCLLLFATTTVVRAETRQEFQEFLIQMKGVWVCNSPSPGAVDGFIASGDTVPCFFSTDVLADCSIANVSFHAGPYIARGCMFFDPAQEEIRLVWSDSDGVCSREKVEKVEGGWRYTGTRSMADGKSVDVKSEIKFSSDGAAFELASNVGDAEALKYTSKRICEENSEHIAEPFKKFGEQFVGRWTRDIRWITDWKGADGKQGEKSIGYDQWRWIAGGHAIEHTTFAGELTVRELLYWDMASQMIVGCFTNSEGLVCSLRIKELGKDTWLLHVTGGSDSDGKAILGAVTYKVEQAGQVMRMSGKLSLDGKPTEELTDVYYRISQ